MILSFFIFNDKYFFFFNPVKNNPTGLEKGMSVFKDTG